MTNLQLENILHTRIVDYCLHLYKDSHFKFAALEAMTQVELALREKGLAHPNAFGRRLVQQVLGNGHNITLSVPLGEDLQEEACELFKGAFGYYRNYAAHDGAKIDEKTCIRIMILASELLDLIAASQRSYVGIGGVDGLIKQGLFKDVDEFKRFLNFIGGQQFPYEAFDGFFEELHEQGFNEIQMETVFDLGLVIYNSKVVNHSLPGDMPDYDDLGWMELTEQGQRVLDELDRKNSKSS